MSENLLEKVIDTTDLGATDGVYDAANDKGMLQPEQANRFIDYMFDVTVLGKLARTVRLASTEAEIAKVSVGERIARGAKEAVDTGENAEAVFSKITINTKKYRLDWELSSESLEDGIEGDDLEDHIARLMSSQLGNDLEDAFINGDSANADPLLKVQDGVMKELKATANVVSAGGSVLERSVFNKGLKAMPRKFMQRRGELAFFVGSNPIQDYLFSLADISTSPEDIASSVIRNGPVRTSGPAGFATGFAFGVPVVEVPLFDTQGTGSYSGATGDHADVLLTYPKNLIWGVHRDIQVFREFKPKKDSIEYTVYTRVGWGVENAAAAVVVTDVAVSE